MTIFSVSRYACDLFGQATGVFERRGGIVDRARSDDDDQARIAAVNDVAELAALGVDELRRGIGDRQVGEQRFGRQHFFHAGDPDIVGVILHRIRRARKGGNDTGNGKSGEGRALRTDMHVLGLAACFGRMRAMSIASIGLTDRQRRALGRHGYRCVGAARRTCRRRCRHRDTVAGAGIRAKPRRSSRTSARTGVEQPPSDAAGASATDSRSRSIASQRRCRRGGRVRRARSIASLAKDIVLAVAGAERAAAEVAVPLAADANGRCERVRRAQCVSRISAWPDRTRERALAAVARRDRDSDCSNTTCSSAPRDVAHLPDLRALARRSERERDSYGSAYLTRIRA